MDKIVQHRVNNPEELAGLLTWSKLKGETIEVQHHPRRGLQLDNLAFVVTGVVGVEYMLVYIRDNTKGEYDTRYSRGCLPMEDLSVLTFFTYRA